MDDVLGLVIDRSAPVEADGVISAMEESTGRETNGFTLNAISHLAVYPVAGLLIGALWAIVHPEWRKKKGQRKQDLSYKPVAVHDLDGGKYGAFIIDDESFIDNESFIDCESINDDEFMV